MKSPLENSPKHIELLGIITARWATMDIALLGLTAAAMRGDYNLATATYFSSNAQSLRFDLIRALIKTTKWSKEQKDEATKLIDKVDKLWETRNKVIHCYAGERTLPKRVEYLLLHHKPARKDKEYTETPVTIDFLQTHADKISDLGEKIISIAHRDFYRPEKKAKQKS
jgi:hypothetical protein